MDNFDENKKYFCRYLKYVNQIDKLLDRYNELSSRVYSIQSKKLDGMPKKNTVHFMDEDVIELDELEHRIKQLRNESNSLKYEIFDILDHLPNPTQSTILEKKFLHDKTLQTIAEEINMSDRQTARLYYQVMNDHILSKAPLID